MNDIDNLELESENTNQYRPPSPFQLTFDKMVGDMRFVGMFSIIYGAITCLTIIGAVFGIPTIILGLRLREAADQFAIYKTTNDANAMRMGFEIQGRMFRLLKILIIIGLVITVLYIIVIIIFISYGIGSLMQLRGGY